MNEFIFIFYLPSEFKIKMSCIFCNKYLVHVIIYGHQYFARAFPKQVKLIYNFFFWKVKHPFIQQFNSCLEFLKNNKIWENLTQILPVIAFIWLIILYSSFYFNNNKTIIVVFVLDRVILSIFKKDRGSIFNGTTACGRHGFSKEKKASQLTLNTPSKVEIYKSIVSFNMRSVNAI